MAAAPPGNGHFSPAYKTETRRRAVATGYPALALVAPATSAPELQLGHGRKRSMQ